MKRSVLELHNAGENIYQAFIKNLHGRRMYLKLSIVNGECEILCCFYIDRTSRSEPQLLETRRFPLDELITVVARELDKSFGSYEFVDGPIVPMEDFIQQVTHREKYKILIMLKDGETLKTIFRNRFRRSIYLEIDTSGEKALINVCKYCDVRGVGVDITPYHLTTIYFHYDKDFTNLLNIVNNELEGGFTDVVITESHTIVLDRPICGSI